jgi:hypothetical protein
MGGESTQPISEINASITREFRPPRRRQRRETFVATEKTGA